ncbi:MAG: ankyrin repeat domain-containing protein, partial [Steroidobacteraceae bacterium]
MSVASGAEDRDQSVKTAGGHDLRVLEAVKQRDQRRFNELLSTKADITAAEQDGATALASAVYLGQREMADALLLAGAKVDTTDYYGESPLTLAAANGDGVLVERLLTAGARADTTRRNGQTVLMLAANAGSIDSVSALIRHGADVNAAEPSRGQTVLMWAAAEGHSEVIDALLAAGARVDGKSTGGATALAFASAVGDPPSIKALLAGGADPNFELSSGGRPLLVALSSKHTDAAMALLEGGAKAGLGDRTGMTPLHFAAQNGDMTVVHALLARHVDVNTKTVAAAAAGGAFFRAPNGQLTPLMLAAQGDHEAVMRTLVAAGADPLLRSQNGSNLVMLAAGAARLNTVKYAYGFDPQLDIVLPGGNTIMHSAVSAFARTQQEVVEVIQFLADKGAALDEANSSGQTPISQADVIPVDMASHLLGKLIRERGG